MSAARHVSLGVAGALGAEVIGRLAPDVEAAGFSTLWVNDTPDGDALAALEAAAATTDRLTLATGVIPVDRRGAQEIARAVQTGRIPVERLVLGIGSGAARRGSLRRIREAVEVLRAETAARIVVGALGPRMRRLGADLADGVLLNWVPAELAAEQAREAHARSAGAHVAVYVRTALDPEAGPVLEREAARYGGIAAYAANLQRMGVSAAATTFPDEQTLVEQLPAYERGVDEVVLRVVTAGSDLAAYRRFVATAARSAGLPA